MSTRALSGYSRVDVAARLGRCSRLPSYECRGAAPACHALDLPWDMSVYAKCVGHVALARRTVCYYTAAYNTLLC